jgi:hypothetical protein
MIPGSLTTIPQASLEMRFFFSINFSPCPNDRATASCPGSEVEMVMYGGVPPASGREGDRERLGGMVVKDLGSIEVSPGCTLCTVNII